ncbi:MAG: SDR family NAD(P)-dependent oxidoreductase [Deltaproteobacteria bacterium]|nr:SDR family NAD(P)-dependent oxidoreductase [Deltaproteobacteria bacterium]MBI3017151.1 SDR family NAD(P)-dependent oxidoreductase [Deltaproteobacteria bacterium]
MSVILITGAAKRLGRELAIALSDRGAKIALHYHTSEAEAQDTLKTILKNKKMAHLFKANLASVSETEKMVSQVIQHFGRIDVLINNAGVFYATPFGQIKEQEWDQFLDTNLKGPFFCIQAVAQQMLSQKGNLKQYKIINIADSGGPRTRVNYLPYWISKSGLMAMTETLAKIFTPGIQVNTICPGPIGFPEDLEKLKNQMPIDPKEIVNTVLYLIESVDSVTGNTFIIDQGRRYT